MKTLIEDRRPIRLITNDLIGENLFKVGVGGVVRMESYGEPSNMANLPAVAIYIKGDSEGQPSSRLLISPGMAIHYAETIEQFVEREGLGPEDFEERPQMPAEL